MSKSFKYDAKEVTGLANGHWATILRALADGSISPAIDHFQANRPRAGTFCPRHGGKSGKAFVLLPEPTGASACGTCGTNPTGFHTLMFVNGWTYGEAVDAVGDYIRAPIHNDWKGHSGKVTPIRSQPREMPKDVASEDITPATAKYRLSQMRTLWKESISIMDPKAEPARLYLKSRGIDPTVANEYIRFSLKAYYRDNADPKNTGFAFAILIKQVNPQGYAVNVHRTYITADGKKLAIDGNKKFMSKLGTGMSLGAAMRLGDGGSILAVGEGLETVLSVKQVYRDLPITFWACGSWASIRDLVIPESTKAVVVFADLEAEGKGEYGAQELVKKLRASGMNHAYCIKPPLNLLAPGKQELDWNDVLMEGNEKDFPQLQGLVQAIFQTAAKKAS